MASRRRVGYAKLQDDEISSIQTFPNPRYALLAQDRLKIVDLLLDRVIWIEPSSNAKESRLNFGPGWAELLVLGKRSIVNLDLAALISLGELPPDLLDASASAPPPLSGSTSPRRRQPAAVASEQLLKGYSAALHGTRFTAENATHARRHLRARLEGAPTAIENFQLEPLLRALDRLVATAERTLDTVELARFRARAADAIQAWDAARTKVQDRSRETEREETRPAKALSRKRRLPLAPSSAAVSPDGELLAVGGYANIESAAAHQLVILRAADVKPLQAEKLPDGVNAVAWSPDGQDLWVATNSATDGGAIMRWRRDQKTSRWEAVSSWSCAREPKGLAISADGRTLFSYGNHASHLEVGNDPLGETLAWDVATGTSRTLDTSRKAYEAIAYQPTSGLLATAAPHEIQIRDTLRGGEPTRIGLRLKGTASFHALAFSGDGKTLVASINERQKNPRRVATQVQVYRQNARGNWVSVHTLAMPGRMATLKPSRDGNWLLSMSPNGDLHVYDVKSGASIYSAEHQENNGNRVAFDPSGPRAFTLNLDDQKVSRWDLGELVRSGELPPGSVSF